MKNFTTQFQAISDLLPMIIKEIATLEILEMHQDFCELKEMVKQELYLMVVPSTPAGMIILAIFLEKDYSQIHWKS